MEKIIENLIVPINDTTIEASEEVKKGLNNPKAISELCELICSHDKAPRTRQCATLILKVHWEQIPLDCYGYIVKCAYNALTCECDTNVRVYIAQLLGCLIRLQPVVGRRWMHEIISHISSVVRTCDDIRGEIAALNFDALTDVVPKSFLPHVPKISEMVYAVLEFRGYSGDFTQPILIIIIEGLTNLVPVAAEHSVAEDFYQKLLPILLDTLEQLADIRHRNDFCRVFELLDAIAEYMPRQAVKFLKPLLKFCLDVTETTHVDVSMRKKAIYFIGCLVCIEKNTLYKTKLLERILQIFFHMLSTPTQAGDKDFFIFDDGENDGDAMGTTFKTLRLISLHTESEKFVPPLLAHLWSSLRSSDPWKERAAFLFMASTAQGVARIICPHHLKSLFKAIRNGTSNQNAIVRRAAFYALEEFVIHMRPDIANYGHKLLPIICQFFDEILISISYGEQIEDRRVEGMFCALKSLSKNMDEEVVPHLPLIMPKIHSFLNRNFSFRVQKFALNALTTVVHASKTQILPYFGHTLQFIYPYVRDPKSKVTKNLCSPAVQCLVGLLNEVGRKNFLTIAPDIVLMASELLAIDSDVKMKCSIYTIMVLLCDMNKSGMHAIMPKVIHEVIRSIRNGFEISGDSGDDELGGDSDDDDNDNTELEPHERKFGFNFNLKLINPKLREMMWAIQLSNLYAEKIGEAFIPYLRRLPRVIYSSMSHASPLVRNMAISTLVVFALLLNKAGNLEDLNHELRKLIPSISEVIHKDDDIKVAITGLEAYIQLLIDINKNFPASIVLRESIFWSINDVLEKKTKCQRSPNDTDNELLVLIQTTAHSVFQCLRLLMKPVEFNEYFENIFVIMLKQLEALSEEEEDLAGLGCSIYKTIVDGISHLGPYAANYFDKFCAVLIEGLNATNELARQNAAIVLGDLVIAYKSGAYHAYPRILHALAKRFERESRPGVLDSLCVTMACVIIANPDLVPLEKFVPVLFYNLPIKEQFNRNKTIINCFQVMYDKIVHLLSPAMIEQIMMNSMHIFLMMKQDKPQIAERAMQVLEKFRSTHPETFGIIINSRPKFMEILKFISLL